VVWGLAMMLSELKDVLSQFMLKNEELSNGYEDIVEVDFYTHMAIKTICKNKCCTFVIEI
jgi:hypothetical protein